MGVEVIVAIVSGLVTLAVCMLNNHYQRIESEEKHAETLSLITYRLDALTKQVEKHNQIVERTYALEKEMEVVKVQLDSIRKEAS